MIWGYACPWYGEFLALDEDPLYARLKFLVEHDLTVTGVPISEIADMTDAERDLVAQFLVDHSLQLAPHVGLGYISSEAEAVKRETEAIVNALERYLPLLRGTIVKTTAGAGHRFDRDPPLEAKLERMSSALAPLAAACWDLGAPLAIENHGDFYCSDLVALCERTPHLHIFLDTGNTYLIGEQPMPAFEAAAPHTVGTHFKDHRVRPRLDARPLHFEVGGSPLGEGDVPLRECYDLLLARAPYPDKLVMEIEMICPEDMSALECLDRSLSFIRSLPEPHHDE